MKSKKLKPIKAWAVIQDGKLEEMPCILGNCQYCDSAGDVLQIFSTKEKAKEALDYHWGSKAKIIPILISPINPKKK